MIYESPNTYISQLKRNLILFRVLSFLHSLMFFIPIWYLWETQFASLELIGILCGVQNLLIMFLELPTGALADLVGRRNILILGMFISAVNFLFLAFYTNVSQLVIIYLIQAISAALISGADVAIQYDTMKELGREKDYSKQISIQSLYFRIGMSIALILGGYLYQISHNLPYILTSISWFLTSIIYFIVTEPKIDSEKFTLVSYIQQTKTGFKQLFRDKYIKALSFYYILLGGIGWYFIYFLEVPFMTQSGINAKVIGWSMGIMQIVIAILGIIITKKEKIKRKSIFIAITLTFSIGFALAIIRNPVLTIFLSFILQSAGILRFMFLDRYVNEEFDSKYRATAVSSLSMGISLIYVLISFIGGVISSYFGIQGIMFFLSGISILIGIPLTLNILNNKQKTLYQRK